MSMMPMSSTKPQMQMEESMKMVRNIGKLEKVLVRCNSLDACGDP
jgi:hypothetical protein